MDLKRRERASSALGVVDADCTRRKQSLLPQPQQGLSP
jgi:hypothetical protein